VSIRSWLAVGGIGVVALGASACGSDKKSSSGSGSSTPDTSASTSSTPKVAAATINGAGSTFAAPIYEQWGSTLKSSGVTVNFQPVGSGAGIAALAAGTADWAGSDPPLTPQDTASLKKGTALNIPIALGAITASYNLSGVKSGLRLDGKTLADIFLGKVKKWDDPEIAGQNSGVSLPSTSIAVVHRSDSSGTTKGFTGFLAAYSPQWKSEVGVDKDVQWPTGTGAKGNAGVAGAVKQTDGAIGYVEQAYALQNNFTYASVKNRSGKYVAPTLPSTSAAARGITVPANLAFTAIDSPNPAAYPITSQTFVIAYQDLCKGGMSQAVATAFGAFIKYGLGAGQAQAKALSYAPLPAALLSKAQAAADSLTCNGTAVGG
jgi:phosphate transport system substrate-binding protein